jgi:hypothetical protein
MSSAMSCAATVRRSGMWCKLVLAAGLALYVARLFALSPTFCSLRHSNNARTAP